MAVDGARRCRPTDLGTPGYPPAMAIEDKDTTDLSVAPIVGPDDPRRFTDSGIEIKPLYTEQDLPEDLDLGEPGEFPFTRGIHREMYRKRRWTMRQYAGYASARESNERYKYLLEHGSTGLSMAFDLPTQLGLDSDDPRCLGEVGRTGVAIDTLEDMRMAFDGIPLDEVSTSMTINAPRQRAAAALRAGRRGAGRAEREAHAAPSRTTSSRSTSRAGTSSTRPSRACGWSRTCSPTARRTSRSGTRSRSRATTSARRAARPSRRSRSRWPTAWPTCRRRSTPGLKVDDFAPRLAFFFNGHNNVFQEVAKFRAARNMWAHAMKERFGAQDPKSQTIRFHTQTGGVDAHRPAARQQHRPRRAAGLRGRLRRHPVAAHQRLRRGARAAERARGQDRAAHPADPRPRVGRRRHRRPVRRLLLRRVADRRHRAPRLEADREDRRDGRLRGGDRASSRARSRSPPSATTSATARGRTSSSASTSTRRTTSRSRTSSASTPRPSRTSWTA